MTKTGLRRKRTGVVSKVSGKDTVKVQVKSRKPHALYKKVINFTQSFMAHDQGNQANEGDLVEIEDTRPISKTKKWRVIRIVERARTLESDKE
ncbi:MAG: 30S ribosomal protein S17 [bacterium]|nr:30S ribosomal protein S17 [bacterium]